MKNLFHRWYYSKIKDLFSEKDAETVTHWAASLDGRKPIAIIGSGFSRNARGGSQIPLWADLTKIFKSLIGSGAESYADPLLLAEFARKADRHSFTRRLLDALPDKRLHPGKAHFGLYRYPLAAVITTNQLDTLLDRASDWHRVVKDHDLALCIGSKPPLLYVHGHRSDVESWVFTRSEYQQLPRRRPVMLAKARQLLAEHPPLILGYSLQDPDFQQLYLQLAENMVGLHPRGLVITVGSSPDAERDYWGNLGLRIVEIRKEKSYDDAFSRFLECHPRPEDILIPLDRERNEPKPRSETNASDTASLYLEPDGLVRQAPATRPPVSDSEQRPDKNKLLKELTKVLDKEPDLRERVGLFAELLPELEGLSREDIPFQTLIDLWKATIEAEFPKKLRNVFDNLDFAKRKKLFQEGLLRLPCPRFQASLSGWDPILVVDQLLYTTGYHHKPQELLAIAQWLMAAVDLLANRNVEISDISLKRILALASWVWVEINKLSACQPQEVRENLWRCYDLVDQYGLIETSSGPPLFDREGDLQAVGTMPSTSLTNFREIMREARVAFLDCDYDKAEKLYEKAEAIARGRDPFHIWFARAGLHDALSALEYKSRSEDDEKEFAHKLGIAKQALRDSETNRRVRRWKELVNQRVQVLQSDQLQDSRRIRLSLHAESSPGCHYSEPNLHQMFRALEHDYAPASLLQRYFHPLFDATPVTSKLVGKSVLSYRLWFGRDSKKTTLALKELLSDSHQTGEERAERDRSIVETALDLSTEQTGAKSRYEIFPIITEFLRDEDTERVKTFFTECKYRPSTLGDEITMWEAVGAFARCTDPETADTVASNLEPNLRGLRTQPNLKKSWLLNPIGAWPWTFWGYTSPRESEKLLSTWMGKYHDTDGFHECFTGIIATWLIAAGRDSLSREGDARMPIENMLKDWSSERWQNHERWKLFIRIGVGIDPDDTGQTLLKEADETCAERLRAARNLKDPNKRLDLVTQARDFIYMALLCTKEILSSTLEWLSLYKEERTSEMISNSFFPYDGAIDVRVLGAALYVVEPAERETIIDHILKWVRKSPKTLGHIPRSSLRPELWGSSWNRLLDLVKELAAAPGLEGREKIHFGLLKAFSLLHQRPCDAEDRPHPELTDLLQQLPPRYVNHRVQDLAAQAISALMTDCGSHPDDLPFAHQIEEATEDPRILVRGVTAYHAERLAKKMSDTKLGELAVKLTAQFAGDPYLFVANQRKLALAEPDYFPEFFRTRREE